MNAKIHLPVSEIWAYFLKNKVELEINTTLIAEAPDYGVEVYLCSLCGYPCISVVADDIEIHSEVLFTPEECISSASEVYSVYLTPKIISALGDDGENISLGRTGAIDDDEILSQVLDQSDAIEEREGELDCAIYDLLAVLVEGKLDKKSSSEIIEDIKDHVCEYIARKHKLRIFRPMYLSFPTGIEYVEYPYECMEFDDNDNPIYS